MTACRQGRRFRFEVTAGHQNVNAGPPEREMDSTREIRFDFRASVSLWPSALRL
jgi:hypothetical protein